MVSGRNAVLLSASAAIVLISCAATPPPEDAASESAAVQPAAAPLSSTDAPALIVVDGGARALTEADLEPQINVKAAFMHRVPELRDQRAGYKPTGQGVLIGVWDGGPILSTHVAFGGRVSVAENVYPPDSHSTHVAGTIAAQEVPGSIEGVEGKGVAYGARLLSYDFQGDPAAELADAVARLGDAPTGPKMRVSNHSYGTPVESSRFNRAFDAAIRKDPRIVAIVAAGNQTCDCETSACARIVTKAGRQCNYDDASGRLRMTLREDEYGTLGSPGAAKNVITVGAMVDLFRVDNATTPGSLGLIDRNQIEPTFFSSIGPALDGRIKPDVIANGYELISPTAPEPDRTGNIDNCRSITPANVRRCYVHMSGTSMATPLTSGVVALLQDLSHAQSGKWLLAEDVKAILIHSAIGKDMRPTYSAGWGAYRADLAGNIVDARRADFSPPANGLVFTRLAVGAQPLTYKVRRIPGEQVRITAVWLDDAGTPAVNGLHRDIDLALTSAASPSASYLPWTLDPIEPIKPAVRNVNRVDNVERIDVATDEALDGDWTLTITRAKPAAGAPVEIALVAQGLIRVD